MNEQIQMLEKAAKLLAALDEKIVFIGGTTIPLYLDEVSAADARSTKDVDCVVNIVPSNKSEYYIFAEKLRLLGLEEDIGGIICRWCYKELIIDIMPTNKEILGFSNPWYQIGFQESIVYKLPSQQRINIFPVTYLLASKIEAFNSRGKQNLYSSHDLEDIILLLDGCPYIEENIQKADTKVKNFIKKWFESEVETLTELAPAHLSQIAINAGREELLLSLIERLANHDL